MFLKTRVKIAIVRSGWKSAHAAPIAVCLYLILMSRQARKYSSSRYAHSSRRPSDNRPSVGSMLINGTRSAVVRGASAVALCRVMEANSGFRGRRLEQRIDERRDNRARRQHD